MMRISRLIPDNPTGRKHRHFEICINLPLTLFNCRATQANTSLPAYSSEICRTTTYQPICGCPDICTIPTETSPHTSM
ncbi:hypothetical protein BGZ63DRAFT_436663, partial [Mariannaea sp. PMI_226]